MTPRLSVVLPAYNESSRLPPYLVAIRYYLDKAFPNSYEVVVVDDGSDDGLDILVDRLRADWPPVTLLRHKHNRGKGAALRSGTEAVRGELVLFADADGATPIDEESKLRKAIRAGASVAVGSRLLRLPGEVIRRTLRRDLAGRAFSRLARALFGLPIWETQCGFKMFRRETLLPLLDLCHETGYLLDLEILVWAHRLGCRIAEVPINWRDVAGSKVRLLRDGWAMLRGLFRLRRALRKPPFIQCPNRVAPGSALCSPLPWDRASFPSLESQGP
jgi:dolichyl-phosphate beta-glucosyltransferase